MVGGDHAGVVGMELRRETFALEPVIDGVDARGDDEHRTLLALREKVAHWAVERAGQSDLFSLAGDDGERAFDATYRLCTGFEKEVASLFQGEVVDVIYGGIDKINDALDVLVQVVLLQGGRRWDPVYAFPSVRRRAVNILEGSDVCGQTPGTMRVSKGEQLL